MASYYQLKIAMTEIASRQAQALQTVVQTQAMVNQATTNLSQMESQYGPLSADIDSLPDGAAKDVIRNEYDILVAGFKDAANKMNTFKAAVDTAASQVGK